MESDIPFEVHIPVPVPVPVPDDDLIAEVERLRAELAAMQKQRDEARRWLRDACAEIARIETRFYDALTPQEIAERNGWHCFPQKEGGGA
jgi:hypothetical protein